MGSYEAAKYYLNTHAERKIKLPLVIWQSGKSFRKEIDQPTKFMRLKEFYQLEFQILFSPSTGNDYYPSIVEHTNKYLSSWIVACKKEASDRLPSYVTETTDIICETNSMEVASISRRTDLEGIKNIEVAIGLDRGLYCRNLGYLANN